MDFPRLILAKQHYRRHPQIGDPAGETSRLLRDYGLSAKVRPGMRVAVAVGSRGVHGMVDVVARLIEEIKLCGGDPFIFPAMGSHGGATAQGQLEMLRGLGYTDEVVKCPIISNMETTLIGETELGTPVYIDKTALAADGVILVNRIKKHTEHHNKTESGLLKMMTIGMGKKDMAVYVHARGVWGLTNIIPANGSYVCHDPRVNVICGLALIENQSDQLGYLEVVDGPDIPQREPALYKMAEELFPFLPFDTCDLLVVRRGGKNISGTGMDCNMIGRFGVWGLYEPEKLYSSDMDFGSPLLEKIALLDLTEQSHGNAVGMGQADIITKRYFDKIDYAVTYMNGITTTFLDKIKTPYVAPTDRQAIQVGLDSLNGLMRLEGRKDTDTVKLCVIDSTLHRGRFLVSPGLYESLKRRDDMEFQGGFKPMEFDADGALLSDPLMD